MDYCSCVEVSFILVAGEIADLLGPFSGLVRPLFFLVFFTFTAVALYYRDRVHLRKSYLTFFFICLLVVNIVSVQMFPVVHFHKFSSPGPEHQTLHEIRIVDENGNELDYDPRATPPLTGSRVFSLGERMVHDSDEQKRCDTAEFILTQSHDYRTSVESGENIQDRIQFPRHTVDYKWTGNALNDYDEFVKLKIYETNVEFSGDGSGAEVTTEELVYEWPNEECEQD